MDGCSTAILGGEQLGDDPPISKRFSIWCDFIRGCSNLFTEFWATYWRSNMLGKSEVFVQNGMQFFCGCLRPKRSLGDDRKCQRTMLEPLGLQWNC